MIFWKLSDVSELHIQHTSFIAFGVFFLRTCISCKVEQMFTSQLTWIVFPVNSTVTTLRARPTLLQLLCFHFESTLRLVRNVIIILKYTNTAVATFKQIIVLVTTPPIDFFFFLILKFVMKVSPWQCMFVISSLLSQCQFVDNANFFFKESFLWSVWERAYTL